MNIKINLWTLFFVFAVSGCCNSKYITEFDSSATLLNEISQDTFLTWYTNYKESYLPVMNDPTLNLKNSIGVDNLGIEYYKLQEIEVAQLYYFLENVNNNNQIDTNLHVYLFPVIKENNGKRELDIVFSIMKDPSKLDTGVQFDFSKPCPPICGSEYTKNGN